MTLKIQEKLLKGAAEMLASEQGRAVTKKYLTVAKSMREYEEQVQTTILLNALLHDSR